MSRLGNLTEDEKARYAALTFRMCQEDYWDVSGCDCPSDCEWVQQDSESEGGLMQEQDMPREMLAEKLSHQLWAEFVRLERHPGSVRYRDEITEAWCKLHAITHEIPRRRGALEEQLAALDDESADLLEEARGLLGALEFNLEKPEDWGTRRE